MRIALNYVLNNGKGRAVHSQLLRLPSLPFSMHVNGPNAPRFVSKSI